MSREHHGDLPTPFILRAMTAADEPFVALVYIASRAEELAVTGWPEEQKQSFLRQQHEAQRLHYRQHYEGAEWLIIESGGRPVGRLYRAEWPREIRIMDVSLLPQARGRGIGTRILQDIQQEGATRGKAVSIHVEKNNPAWRLYARLGFEVVEYKGVYDLMEWRPAQGDQQKIAS